MLFRFSITILASQKECCSDLLSIATSWIYLTNMHSFNGEKIENIVMTSQEKERHYFKSTIGLRGWKKLSPRTMKKMTNKIKLIVIPPSCNATSLRNTTN